MRLKDVSVEGFFKVIFATYLVVTLFKLFFMGLLALSSTFLPFVTLKPGTGSITFSFWGAKFYPSSAIEIGFSIFIAFISAFIGLLIFSSFMHWICQRTRIGNWKIG